MVARAGRCCGTLFKGYFGVTQVDTLSPTTINLVVYAVIQKWVIDVAAVEGGFSGFRRAVQMKASFFYSDNGILTYRGHLTF